MLGDHGMAAAGYKDVKANTCQRSHWETTNGCSRSKRIGWTASSICMRDLRDTKARLHVREEIPFFMVPRRELVDIISDSR